jgi:hypothetical protein
LLAAGKETLVQVKALGEAVGASVGLAVSTGLE